MNSYEKAKQEHYDLYFKQSKVLHSWKIAFFLSMIFNIFLITVSGYLTTRGTLIPYVIEVDETGNAKAINPATQKEYIPSEIEKEYFLKKFIKNARFISKDFKVLNTNFNENRSFLSSNAQTKYLETIEKEGIKDLVDKNFTRDINILNINKIAGSENSYQVRWNEIIFSGEGKEFLNNNLTGIFKINIIPPKNLAELNINPLGIIIDDFSWSIEL